MILLLIVDTWGKGVEKPPKWVSFTTKLATLIKFQKIRFKQLAKINFLIPISIGLYLLVPSLSLPHSSRSDCRARKGYIFPTISTKSLKEQVCFHKNKTCGFLHTEKQRKPWKWALQFGPSRSNLHYTYFIYCNIYDNLLQMSLLFLKCHYSFTDTGQNCHDCVPQCPAQWHSVLRGSFIVIWLFKIWNATMQSYLMICFYYKIYYLYCLFSQAQWKVTKILFKTMN